MFNDKVVIKSSPSWKTCLGMHCPLAMTDIARCQLLRCPVNAGHYYDRIAVTSIGCFIWGTMTTGFAFCTSIGQGMFFWAVNGIGASDSLISHLNKTL